MCKRAIHKRFIEKLNDLKISKANIKPLIKSLHHNAIKYLACLILNKRKLDVQQTNTRPPTIIKLDKEDNPRAHLLTGGMKSYVASRNTVINTRPTCSLSSRYFDTGIIFLFLFFYMHADELGNFEPPLMLSVFKPITTNNDF